MGAHRVTDDPRYRREPDEPNKKPLHRNLVCGVQHDWKAPLGLERAIRQSEAWKGLHVRLVELETPCLNEIERR